MLVLPLAVIGGQRVQRPLGEGMTDREVLSDNMRGLWYINFVNPMADVRSTSMLAYKGSESEHGSDKSSGSLQVR